MFEKGHDCSEVWRRKKRERKPPRRKQYLENKSKAITAVYIRIYTVIYILYVCVCRYKKWLSNIEANRRA